MREQTAAAGVVPRGRRRRGAGGRPDVVVGLDSRHSAVERGREPGRVGARVEEVVRRHGDDRRRPAVPPAALQVQPQRAAGLMVDRPEAEAGLISCDEPRLAQAVARRAGPDHAHLHKRRPPHNGQRCRIVVRQMIVPRKPERDRRVPLDCRDKAGGGFGVRMIQIRAPVAHVHALHDAQTAAGGGGVGEDDDGGVGGMCSGECCFQSSHLLLRHTHFVHRVSIRPPARGRHADQQGGAEAGGPEMVLRKRGPPRGQVRRVRLGPGVVVGVERVKDGRGF